jgi:hypothetical protein
MYHCSTKWAVFLLSLKSFLETGKGASWPNEIKLDSWEPLYENAEVFKDCGRGALELIGGNNPGHPWLPPNCRQSILDYWQSVEAKCGNPQRNYHGARSRHEE